MSKKSVKRPAGLMDQFVIKTGSSKSAEPSAAEPILPPPKRSKHRLTGFNPDWKKDFPWVEEFENGMRCHLCIVHQRRPKKVAIGKAVWVDKPCLTVARDSLNKHDRSDSHKEAKAFETERCAQNNAIESAVDNATSINKMARVGAFRNLYWLAKEEIAHTTKYKPLLELCKLQGVSSLNNLHQGGNNNGESERFVQEAMLTLEKTVKNPILEDLRTSPYYAILIDETTDIEIVKELIVYARYIKDGQCQTKFLRIVPLINGKADTIMQALLDLLAELSLPIQKMCAIGSDGANVMVGRNNGVAAKLREHVPSILSIHCVAHRLALAAGQATRGLPYLQKFKDILDQLFRFYHNSAVRYAGLKEIQKIMDGPTVKLQQAKDVRWLSHDNATSALHRSLPSVITSLEREAEERSDAQAMGLSVFIQNTSFIHALLMMRDVLPPLAQLSKSLQERDLNFTTVGPLVNGTVAVLQRLREKPGQHYSGVDTYITSLQDQGFNIRKPRNNNNFRENIYNKFLDNLIQNIEERFPDLPVISNFQVFKAASFPVDNDELEFHGNDEIQELSHHFGLDEEKTQDEWRLTKTTIAVSPTLRSQSAEKTMMFIAKELNLPQPNLSKLAQIGLLVPATTADCERGFSNLKRVKTAQRSTLSNKVLNALLTISIQGPPVGEVDFDAVVVSWFKAGPRRVVL